MDTALDNVVFPDKKQEGRFPVLDADGRLLASISVPWGTRKFTALTATGGALCSGKGRAFTRSYDVVDAYGNPLLTMRSGFLSSTSRTVTFANGFELVLRGEKWPKRDWEVREASDRVVVHIEATANWLSSHPDAYSVRVSEPRITLAVLVGIVQANRILVKASRSGETNSSI